jgi:Integrase core domain
VEAQFVVKNITSGSPLYRISLYTDQSSITTSGRSAWTTARTWDLKDSSGHGRSLPASGSVVGHDAPTSPAAVLRGLFTGCTWPGSRWHQSHQEDDSEPLFVAQFGEGHCRLVPQLPSVPGGKGDGPTGGGMVPTLRFSHIHIDNVGPLLCSPDGFLYLSMAVDWSTRQVEALPLMGTNAADCAEAFIAGWVARYGVPSVVTSDRGVQFMSAFWAATMARLGVKHKPTTAFHPQPNGAMERFHRRLKDSLRACLANSDWPQHLPWVMLGLRAAPREDSGLSAEELVFGAPLSLPGPVITTTEAPPEDSVQRLRAGVPCVAPLPLPSLPALPMPPSSLMATAFVYVRALPVAPGLSPMYRGPYEVVKRTTKYFIIKMGSRFDAVTINRLKPHLGGPVVPAAPPRKSGPVGKAALDTTIASTGGGGGVV